jgi:HEAT repeat protein
LLLKELATGSSYLEVHHPLEDPYQKHSTPAIAASLERERAWVEAAHMAVVEGTPVYLQLLENAEPELRRAVPYLLAVCRERQEIIVRALRSGVAAETDPQVKASRILALGRLLAEANAPAEEWRDALVTMMQAVQEAPVVRLGAALSFAGLRGQEPCPELLPVLQGILPAALEEFGELPWGEGDPLHEVSCILEGHPELCLQPALMVVRHPDAELRRRALYVLAEQCRRWRSAPQAVATRFGEALEDPDAGVREEAARSLMAIGTAACLVTDALLAALDDPAPRVRVWAAAALARLQDARAVPALVALLADPENRFYALQALEWLGPAALPAVPSLRALLRTARDAQLRVRALIVLGATGPTAREAFPEMVAALRDPEIHGTAAYALGCWGAEAREAVPHLLPRLRSPDRYARRITARALGRIRPAAAAAQPAGPPNLLQQLRSLALGENDPARALAALLRDRDPELRAEAAFSLWQMEEHPEAVPVLAAVLQQGLGAKAQQAQLACSRAAEGLSHIGAAARSAVPILRAALDHDNEWVRVHAARALWQAEGRAEVVVPVLIEELRGRPASLLAIECLGEMGSLARAAIPALRRIVDSEERLITSSTMDDLVWDDEALQAAAARARARIESR